MSALTDLQQVAADLQISLDTKQSAIAQAIADLEAQIGQGGTSDADLQPIIDSLRATQADIDSTPTA